MNIEELNCPLCKKEYDDENPPRILTICGHTFCHHCIRSLIKKKQKIYRVKCPLEKIVMQVDKPNPTLFPKNMVLLNYLHKMKAKQNPNQEMNQFLQMPIINQPLNTTLEQQPSLIDQTSQISIQCENTTQKTIEPVQRCLIHNKVFQVFCLQHMQMLCTDCAIFGDHRNHKIETLKVLKSNQFECKYQLEQIICQKLKIQQKLQNKQIQDQFLDLLTKKSKIISSDIEEYFNRIHQIVNQIKRKTKQTLQMQTIQIAFRIKDLMKIQHHLESQYLNWQTQAIQIVKNIQQNKLIDFVRNDFFKHFRNHGNNIINKIQKLQKNLIFNIQEEINGLFFQSNHSYCRQAIEKSVRILYFMPMKFQHEAQNHLLQQKCVKTVQPINKQQQKQNIQWRQTQQQSLLDDMQFNTPQNVSCILPVTSSCNQLSQSRFSITSITNKSVMQPKLNQKKKLIVSKKVLSSRSLSTTSLNYPTPQLNQKSKIPKYQPKPGTLKKIQYSKKQTQIMNNLKDNKLESLDLTACNMGEEQLKSVLECVQFAHKLKIIKLMRNKLDDQFVIHVLPYLIHLERINLAQNKISEQVLAKLCQIAHKSHNCHLQYVNFGQNRIVQRKNNKFVDQFDKLGITIVL